MVDAEAEFYRHGYAAVHRGIHTLSAEATQRMENVRTQVAAFLNARSPEELVFVRGTTEGINPVANSWGNAQVHAGITSSSPRWSTTPTSCPADALRACGGATAGDPLNEDGTLQLEKLDALLDDRTRLVAVTHVSNVLGTENPVALIVDKAHQAGAKVLIDGAGR